RSWPPWLPKAALASRVSWSERIRPRTVPTLPVQGNPDQSEVPCRYVRRYPQRRKRGRNYCGHLPSQIGGVSVRNNLARPAARPECGLCSLLAERGGAIAMRPALSPGVPRSQLGGILRVRGG